MNRTTNLGTNRHRLMQLNVFRVILMRRCLLQFPKLLFPCLSLSLLIATVVFNLPFSSLTLSSLLYFALSIKRLLCVD